MILVIIIYVSPRNQHIFHIVADSTIWPHPVVSTFFFMTILSLCWTNDALGITVSSVNPAQPTTVLYWIPRIHEGYEAYALPTNELLHLLLYISSKPRVPPWIAGITFIFLYRYFDKIPSHNYFSVKDTIDFAYKVTLLNYSIARWIYRCSTFDVSKFCQDFIN